MRGAHQPDLNQSTSHLSSSRSTMTERRSLHILVELIQFIRPYRWKVSAALLALVMTACLTLSVGQEFDYLLIRVLPSNLEKH